MSDDKPDDKSKPKSPSRRSLFTSLFDALADREKMGEVGRQAGKTYREFADAAREAAQVGQEAHAALTEAARSVQEAVVPPTVPRAQYEAAEARIAGLEAELAALRDSMQTQGAELAALREQSAQTQQDELAALRDTVQTQEAELAALREQSAQTQQDALRTQALLQKVTEALQQTTDAVNILRASPAAPDQEEAARWARLWERLVAALKAAGPVLAVKTAEALYEGWVQENLWPLLPEPVRNALRPLAPGAPPPQPVSPVAAPEAALPEAPVEAPRQPGGRVHQPELVYVPAGWFLMGSDSQRDSRAYDWETPQHWLWLPSYWIGRYPVTNAEYQAFVAATGHGTPAHWPDGRPPVGKERHPVVYVSWYDARAYCDWLSRVAGRAYRLPIEAEWEKAARGMDGRIWPWGNEPPTRERCNYAGNVGDTPVGKYSPHGDSPYCVCDMAGNVWEWTLSLWGKNWDRPEYGYPYNPLDGRENPDAAADVRRTLRGGSWHDYGYNVRCALRNHGLPDVRVDYGGFRLVSPGFRF